MPCVPKSVDQVANNSTDLHTQDGPSTRDQKDKPRPWHAVQLPEGWEEHMFGLHDRRRSLTPSVSVSSQNSTALILQEDQVEGTPMDKDAGEAEAEAEEVEVNIPADKGSQHPDDGARFGAPLLSYDLDDDSSESSLPPSSPPAEDSSSDTEDEFPPCHPGRHVEHKPKSKGKSRAMDVDNSDIASQDDREHTQNVKFKKTGNLSHAALNEIHDFMTEVKAKAEELGCRHSKSPHDILVAAGLSVKPSHTKLNEANLFHLWYWATQLKPDGADRNTVNNIIMAEYNQLMKDIPKDDTAARKEKLKAVYEWSESSSAVPANKSVKSIAVRVHNAKMQFSGLAEAWLTLEDIEIAGVVMCLRDGNGTEAGLLGMSASASSAAALELCCQMKEIPRDCNCQVFGSMMKEKLIMALKDVRSPGFEYKKLKADALHQLVVPYLWRKLGSMYDRQSDDNDDEKNDHLDGVPEVKIKPWNEDVMGIRDAHPLKGEITLVKAPDGTVLARCLMILSGRSLVKKRIQAPHAQSGIPFPLCKWAHVEVTDNNTVPREASHSDCQMPLHDKGRDACSIAGDHNVVIYPTAFWSKLTGDMHRMHFMTHQHAQAMRTLESLVNLSAPCWLSTMGICIVMLPQATRTHGTLALLNSFHHLGIMSPAQPTAQQWVDRGSAVQYDDKFPEDYLDY
ncbi:hypothetical protein F5J12DRAFT_787350 [Pisolithus orientalis]|uniref:uncharacterized protein n=1 Tax=Pisolithus orientalis TaxID=936130 RepID=UPI00222416EF|nr:uncharacterized protein F5J12DRAFT_787350 [Pisolithus orientalis]KAI5985681.1 hypothetical protein F5J12DRAFT_787350 [Pisolithus orientalis]